MNNIFKNISNNYIIFYLNDILTCCNKIFDNYKKYIKYYNNLKNDNYILNLKTCFPLYKRKIFKIYC